jgi:adenylate cyclase
MQEIERKFLVQAMPANLDAFPRAEIHQGYLAYEPGNRQVRIRQIGDEQWLTVKLREGVARDEVTIPLTAGDFAVLWPLTGGRRLHKTRHRVPHGGLTIEIDVFHGKQEGLVVAEVEFADEQGCRDFIPPAWLGDEVTHDSAYKNTTLAFT